MTLARERVDDTNSSQIGLYSVHRSIKYESFCIRFTEEYITNPSVFSLQSATPLTAAPRDGDAPDGRAARRRRP